MKIKSSTACLFIECLQNIIDYLSGLSFDWGYGLEIIYQDYTHSKSLLCVLELTVCVQGFGGEEKLFSLEIRGIDNTSFCWTKVNMRLWELIVLLLKVSCNFPEFLLLFIFT